MPTDRFIAIDEEGFFKLGDQRLTDEVVGREMFENLELNDRRVVLTKSGGQVARVEAFDQPLVAVQVHREGSQFFMQAPYQFRQPFDLESLSLDDWDRFHGRTHSEIPFVMSRSAQNEFFNLVDGFDDEGVHVGDKYFSTRFWLQPKPEAEVEKSSFWTSIYHEESQGWELNEPSKPLVDYLPKIKLTKSKVIVPGCGTGNDAAFLAEQGHQVTAIDLSQEAIHRAKDKYGHLENLELLQGDIFDLDSSHDGQYNLVFEHTCYCAIPPEKRTDLVKLWKRLLGERGWLIGVFFAWDRPLGPPFGGSEWEIRQRMQKDFDFFHWNRCKNSIERRLGVELLVHAQLRDDQ